MTAKLSLAVTSNARRSGAQRSSFASSTGKISSPWRDTFTPGFHDCGRPSRRSDRRNSFLFGPPFQTIGKADFDELARSLEDVDLQPGVDLEEDLAELLGKLSGGQGFRHHHRFGEALADVSMRRQDGACSERENQQQGSQDGGHRSAGDPPRPKKDGEGAHPGGQEYPAGGPLRSGMGNSQPETVFGLNTDHLVQLL